MSLRHREEQLEAARDDAETQLEQRRVELPNTEEIARYVADFRDFLKEGTIPERKALIRNFVEGIEVVGDEATLTYTIPTPPDSSIVGGDAAEVAHIGKAKASQTPPTQSPQLPSARLLSGAPRQKQSPATVRHNGTPLRSPPQRHQSQTHQGCAHSGH